MTTRAKVLASQSKISKKVNLKLDVPTLFTNAVSCGGVRSSCTVRKLGAPPRKRHHGLGLFLLLLNVPAIMCDKMVSGCGALA